MSDSDYVKLDSNYGKPKAGEFKGETNHFMIQAPPAAAVTDILTPHQMSEEDKELALLGAGKFTAIMGRMVFKKCNIHAVSEDNDIYNYVNKHNESNSAVRSCLVGLCCLTGIGACYLLSKTVLVKQGQYGFSQNNGVPEVLAPGRHLLASPFHSYTATCNSGDDDIVVDPIKIIRIQQGKYGLAYDDGQPEILLPGRHIRKSASFQFVRRVSTTEELIVFGPVCLLTVRSGMVRVCYHKGRVQIYPEGRYYINSPTFQVAGYINTQQQNVRFSDHAVLLDGGISMLVEGLLTYQVVDVELLIKELGDRDLLRSIQDVTKAELSRVFAGVQLEQLATAHGPQAHGGPGHFDEKLVPSGKQGKQNKESLLGEGEQDNDEDSRTKICSRVISYIQPFTMKWGVQIINFQLESTKIKDLAYARDYEEASLKLAKAKASQRAVAAENDILLQKATAAARAQRIKAEGQKDACIIEASGRAEARIIEGKARNDAAEAMTDDFARQLQLNSVSVDFARELQAKVLTVVPGSAVGQMLARDAMLGSSV